jgi:hypothetical protein
MGFKAWYARHTSSPSQYAAAYVSGLLELTGYLAASFVAFSGKQSRAEAVAAKEVIFESHFEMESAGFEPVTKDFVSLTEPSISEMSKEEHFDAAYRDVTAFLCLCSENAALQSMKRENYEQFCRTLHLSLAGRCAGKFGFDPEPRNAFMTIQEFVPVFLCEKFLNPDCFGKQDGLGNLLNHVSSSLKGQTRYAFVVGSNQQPLGCASAFITVLTDIDENIGRCARDLRW